MRSGLLFHIDGNCFCGVSISFILGEFKYETILIWLIVQQMGTGATENWLEN